MHTILYYSLLCLVVWWQFKVIGMCLLYLTLSNYYFRKAFRGVFFNHMKTPASIVFSAQTRSALTERKTLTLHSTVAVTRFHTFTAQWLQYNFADFSLFHISGRFDENYHRTQHASCVYLHMETSFVLLHRLSMNYDVANGLWLMNDDVPLPQRSAFLCMCASVADCWGWNTLKAPVRKKVN